MADVTNLNFRVPGVNTATNYLKQESFVLDFVTASGIAEVGTHSWIKLKKGDALQTLRVIALDGATSSGSATLQFKLAFDGTAANINSTAFALAGLAKGITQNVVVNGIKTFDSEYEGVIQVTVGTAAFTGGKFLVIAETIPAEAFVTNG
jgi:hypothetical protein